MEMQKSIDLQKRQFPPLQHLATLNQVYGPTKSNYTIWRPKVTKKAILSFTAVWLTAGGGLGPGFWVIFCNFALDYASRSQYWIPSLLDFIMVYWHYVNTDKHIEERVIGPIIPSRQRYPSDQKLYIGIDSCRILTLIQCKYCFVVTKDSSSLQEGFPAILSWVIANKNADLVISKTAPSLPLICSEWFCQLAIALNCYRPASSCKIFAKTWLDPQSKMGHCPKHNGGLDNTQHIIFLHIPLFPIFNVRLTMLSHTQDLLNAHFEGYET